MPEIECDMQPKKRGNMFLFHFIAAGIETIEDMKMAYKEILNNENFNRVEFDPFKMESGKNSFFMIPTRWVNDYIKQKIINILMQM